ncbi:MAG: hypothetical protein AB7P03_19775 [Kofleriaceae bacterium]
MSQLNNLWIVAGIAIGVAASAPALADASFEALVEAAQPAKHVEDLVWAVTETCDKGDDVQQRQCRLTRDRRAKQLASATLVIQPEANAFVVGAWSAATKSVPIMLNGCVRCDGVKVYGKPWYVTVGAPRVDAGKVSGNAIYDNAVQFSDEGAANAWIKALRTARIELVVKLADKPRWQVGGKEGVQVELVGYRVVTPCDGAVVISHPPAKAVPADRKACAAQ